MITINSNEVLEALREPLAGIVSAIKLALEQTPPELCADVAERGIVLTGGGALLRDLDRLISEETGLHGAGRRRSADLRGPGRRPRAGTGRHARQRVLRAGVTWSLDSGLGIRGPRFDPQPGLPAPAS